MDNEVEASTQRVRDHLRRPLAGSRDLLMKTAGNTVSEIVPRLPRGLGVFLLLLTGDNREVEQYEDVEHESNEAG